MPVGHNPRGIAITADSRTAYIAAMGSDRIFAATIRHSEATAQAARERGLLVHELDQQNRKGPTWWQLRRGEGGSGVTGPRTAGSVADDLQGLATEIVNRITAAEQKVTA